jgi:S-formylglutathione hydrolase FrmB
MRKAQILMMAIAVIISTFPTISLAHSQSMPGTMKILQVPSPEKDFPVRNVYVWTPPVDSETVSTLPVVYMLHGWPGTPNGLISGTVDGLANAFANGTQPFIAVFPDGNAKTHIDSEWADSYDHNAMIETWLTHNVIAAVEGDNIRTRTNRAIMGFSMGGYGAAIIGLHNPQLFSQVITIAGYFIEDDLTNAFGRAPSNKAKISYQNPSSYLSRANQFRWFLGYSPTDINTLIQGQAQSWGTKIATVKASYYLSPMSGGHSYAMVDSQMAPLTKWLKWSA